MESMRYKYYYKALLTKTLNVDKIIVSEHY